MTKWNKRLFKKCYVCPNPCFHMYNLIKRHIPFNFKCKARLGKTDWTLNVCILFSLTSHKSCAAIKFFLFHLLVYGCVPLKDRAIFCFIYSCQYRKLFKPHYRKQAFVHLSEKMFEILKLQLHLSSLFLASLYFLCKQNYLSFV